MLPPPTFFSVYIDFHRPYLAKVRSVLVSRHLHNAQWGVLKRLYFAEPLTVVDLARLHAVETPTMTAMVKKLEKLGYLEGKTGEDRRKKYCQLTEKGKSVCEELVPVFAALNQKLLMNISADEQEIGMRIFEKLTMNLRDS